MDEIRDGIESERIVAQKNQAVESRSRPGQREYFSPTTEASDKIVDYWVKFYSQLGGRRIPMPIPCQDSFCTSSEIEGGEFRRHQKTHSLAIHQPGVVTLFPFRRTSLGSDHSAELGEKFPHCQKLFANRRLKFHFISFHHVPFGVARESSSHSAGNVSDRELVAYSRSAPSLGV
jgi:hypothetical protein